MAMWNTRYEVGAVNPALCHLIDSDAIISIVVSADGGSGDHILYDEPCDASEVSKVLAQVIATYYAGKEVAVGVEAYDGEIVIWVMDADLVN